MAGIRSIGTPGQWTVFYPGDAPAALQRIQWVKFRNDSASQAPGGAILRITGIDVSDPEEMFFTVDQPNTYGAQYGHAINDDLPVESGKYGRCALGQMVPAKYDSADGTPAYGESWGPRNGSWLLKKNTGGFLALGQVLGSPDYRCLVLPRPMLTVRGQPTADVAAGASGTLTVYTGAFGSETTTSVTISSVRNDSSCTVKGSQIATAAWVPDNGGWQFIVGKTA